MLRFLPREHNHFAARQLPVGNARFSAMIFRSGDITLLF
jgi:hypothetical protein